MYGSGFGDFLMWWTLLNNEVISEGATLTERGCVMIPNSHYNAALGLQISGPSSSYPPGLELKDRADLLTNLITYRLCRNPDAR